MRDMLFSVLCGMLAARGRDESLLGDDRAEAQSAFARMMPELGRIHAYFEVPLTGEMHLRAEAGEGAQAVSDEILIRHVEQADASYQFGKIGEVVNWFDKITVNPDYYSVHDTLGTLMQNPATGAVVGQIMQKARGSRGDVAKSTEGNKALQQMLAGMKLESLLLKAGSNVISKEMIQNINETLQKVPKKGGGQ